MSSFSLAFPSSSFSLFKPSIHLTRELDQTSVLARTIPWFFLDLFQAHIFSSYPLRCSSSIQGACPSLLFAWSDRYSNFKSKSKPHCPQNRPDISTSLFFSKTTRRSLNHLLPILQRCLTFQINNKTSATQTRVSTHHLFIPVLESNGCQKKD